MDYLKEYLLQLESDEKLSKRTLSIQNFANCFYYFEKTGIPSNILLRGTEFDLSSFGKNTSWVRFRDSATLQLNAIDYSKKLTKQDWINLGRETIDNKITKAHLIILSVLNIRDIFKRVTSLTAYYSTQLRTEFVELSSEHATLVIHPVGGYEKFTLGGMIYFALPVYKGKLNTSEQLLCNYTPLTNID